MNNLARKIDKKYSYADYLTWNDEGRWEIIDGVAYSLASPSDIHQDISRELLTEFNNYLRGKKCRVYQAPFDVSLTSDKLEGDDKIYDVVQPDIIIVCDKEKISHKGCKGAPDIVIEILSPSTASKDCLRKRILYEKNKINQYWIIDPDEKEVFILKLTEHGLYGHPERYSKEDKIKVENFEGLEIDLKLIFS